MTTILAWQHIYSNVEKEQSPQGRGGFQTLFYTHAGLTEDEVEEMESSLLYFPSKVEPIKRLFFTTSTGKGVVAQIVFLPNPDQYGRGGRYLAHSLVFAPEALSQFEVDPFRVFRQFSFVTTVDEALAQGDFRTGDIPTVSLELPSSLAGELKAAGQWPTPELKKLTLLALRAEQQAREREAITFTGEPAQIEYALEAAFLAAPVSLRSRCTFDTYFYRCNLVATYFWAIGLPEPPVSIKFVQVDSQSRRVQGDAPGYPETAYERWVIQAIDTGELDEIARYRDNAFALGEWLDGRAYDLSLLSAAPSDLITTVFKVSPESVQGMLRRQIRKKLPASLVDRVANHIYQQATELVLYRQLRQGFELPPLLDVLYESYAARNFEEPPRQEIKDLEELLQKVDHPLLNLFLAYWVSPRKQLPKTLERAEEADYGQFGRIVLKLGLLKPLHLLVPGRGDAFLDLYLTSGMDNLVDLTERLLEVEETVCLSRLSSYVSPLSGKELKKLSRLIEEQAGVPESFRLAVERAIAALPPKKGIKGVLGAMWHREADKK